MAVVGIDLGTTNTVVGIARDGQVTAIRDADGEYLMPSVVSFHPGGSILVGRAAKERRIIDASNTIYSIKRLIGRSWNSEEVTHARARFPFEMREGPGQAALVVARGETFTLPEISAFVLRHAKALAERALGESVDRAVITVPANFNDLQRAATKVAGRVAGLDVLRILNEPTAAALAYGYGRGKGERVAIYDFGGGTFDVTILDLSGNVFEVLATAGNTFLGGDDIDIAIAERMALACLERYRVDVRSDAQVFERFRYFAERLKVELSRSSEATVEVPDVGFDTGGRPIHLTYRMTATELDALAAPLVDRTFEVCREAMGIARLTPSDVHQVVLVGGCTRLPIVRDRVAEYFGQPPLNRMNPDEVVAIGAAIQANALTGQERKRSLIPKPPMPAAADGRRSRPPGGIRKTDPFGMPSHSAPALGRPPSSRPPTSSARPSSTPKATEERRRVITGMGLGPAPRQSKPPPVPKRRSPPAKIGDTLGGVGSQPPAGPNSAPIDLTTDVSDPFDPPTPVSSFFPDDETTKVGSVRDLLGGTGSLAEATLATPAAPRPPLEPRTSPRTARSASEALPIATGLLSPIAILDDSELTAGKSPFSSAKPESRRLDVQEPLGKRPPLPLLVDVTPLSLCVETVSGFRDVIITRNTPVPCEQSHTFVTAVADQETALVRVGQGESTHFEENTLLGEVELSGLRKAPRGEVHIVVTFSLDTDGMLDVRAADRDTGHASTARLRLLGLPDVDEVGRMTARHLAQQAR